MQTPSVIESNIELDLLEHIHTNQNAVHQRDLATIISKSLGMTNSILKRLTNKGLLTISKINNRNISYAVTPAGMLELTKRSYNYVKRTIRNVVFFKDAIEFHITSFKENNRESATKIILVGQSDIEFIIKHLANQHGFDFEHMITAPFMLENICGENNYLYFVSEDLDESMLSIECLKESFINVPNLIYIASLFEK